MSGPQWLLLFTFAVGIAQGLFLCVVLLYLERPVRDGTRILAAMVLCFSLMIGEELMDAANLATAFPHVMASTATLDLLIAPLMLLYARSVTHPERRLGRHDLLHALPLVLATVALLPFYLLSGPAKLAFFERGISRTMAVVLTAKVGVVAAYLAMTIRHLRAFLRTAYRRTCPSNRIRHARWYLRAMIALVGVGVGSIALIALMNAGVTVPVDSDYFGTLALSLGIYLIAFLLIKYPLATAGGSIAPVVAGVGGEARSNGPKYRTSPLTPLQKQGMLDRLRRHMEAERPFLDTDLDLAGLAGGAGIAPSHLSQVLNELLGANFYEFVSAYRVRHVQARIADHSTGGKTLLALAHESGFNSKASFNRAFKRVTGLTPSAYADRARRETPRSFQIRTRSPVDPSQSVD